ncbi:MAG: Integration host factor subunit alpha [Alphaproteobacteria bacterium MarineAlpha6_Bin4]|nr:MAG: Integration host factor subunit alpha [Alphaproteobacteria bacterium MarineAlpha6_Bin3]PPR37806.1 MAG: Integration host factor subunit alpha [Alphaproteobacteria bacterium MarineAlpha6_Bin4]|tara:strand:- start:2866 stop:3159 length:294 start_codon:yes stop_codon:yes gene_type:complete
MSDKSLTRVDIANVVKKEIGISRSESSYFVDTIINEIVKSLIEKKILKISSFGTLKLRYKKERIGRNPKTGVEHTISSRNTISFIASKILKKKINSR